MEVLIHLAGLVSILTGNVIPHEPPGPLPEVAGHYIHQQEVRRLEAEKAKLKQTSSAFVASTKPPVSKSGGYCSLEYIGARESGNNYAAQNKRSTASGKYQYLDSTWNSYSGYARAKDAPPSVQDERASKDLAAGKQRQWEVCK